MLIEIVKFIGKETEGSKFSILIMSLTSGISRGLLLAIINATAASAITYHINHSHIAYFILFFLLYICSSYYVKVNSSSQIESARQRLTLRLCDKLLLAELHLIESFGQNDLFQKIRTDLNTVCNVATNVLSSGQASILLFFCLLYITWLLPVALFFTLLTIIAAVSIYLYQNRKIVDSVRETRKTSVEVSKRVNDLLRGFKELKVSRNKRTDFNRHVTEISNRYKTLNIKVSSLQAVTFITTQVFIFSLIAVVIFILPGRFMIDNTITFQFFASILFLIGPLETLISSFQNITKANVALENIYQLENILDQSISELKDNNQDAVNFRLQNIELNDVCFRYKLTHTDDIFEIGPINLNIVKGEILFIVGGNGTGKTTFLKILAGLYVPSSGSIRINGQQLTLENYQRYREMFTTIFDDFHLFERLYGIPSNNLMNISTILKNMKLDKKTHFENDHFTSINLSRGQKKRLAYTVSCLEDKQIIIFDEFATDQDPEFRKYFYHTILPQLKAYGKTVVAVTHDDTYFDVCDQLIKMDYGMIVDYTNSHSDLKLSGNKN